VRIVTSIENALLLLDPREGRERGEEPIQLVEGATYEYELSNTVPGLRIRASRAVSRALIQGGVKERGTISPGLHTGLLPLVLEDAAGNAVAAGAVEVRSTKLNYREDYRRMLEAVAEKSVDLLMQTRAPARVRLSSDPRQRPETLRQQFYFLRAVVGSREFADALQQILNVPHRLLRGEEVQADIRRGFKPNAKTLRQLARGYPRTPLPVTHPLHARMRSQGIDEPSVPERLPGVRRYETIDTPENRFVKHVLTAFADFLSVIEKRLTEGSKSDEVFARREVAPLREELHRTLARDFFREVSDIENLPVGSQVLQRRGGYREVLQAWLRFNVAAMLTWEGGEDVFGGEKRDVAALYEYWLFFEMLDLISRAFRLDNPQANSLLEPTKDGFGLKLKSGVLLALRGSFLGPDSRKLRMEFSYNRTFPGQARDSQRNYPSPGSWTRPMRPDFTLSFWPAAFGHAEAERQELMVHLHFDAKYRVETVEELFGRPDEDLQADRNKQRQGTYKRADLLKMHAYRDAIRRSEGAYVLYPGHQGRMWYGFHEILPGLGAFVARPGAEGEEGLKALADFLEQVVAHLCDRAASRERLSYHLYQTQKEPSEQHVSVPIPERDASNGEREPPPAETFVLVGRYDDAHLELIRRSKVYFVPISNPEGLLRMTADMIAARYLLLLEPGGDGVEMWRLSNAGPYAITAEALSERGYAEPLQADTIYAVYEIADTSPVETWHPDIPESLRERFNRNPSGSFTLTLSGLMPVAAAYEASESGG
jgi:predicted component of viral defense system (DUF524 family)